MVYSEVFMSHVIGGTAMSQVAPHATQCTTSNMSHNPKPPKPKLNVSRGAAPHQFHASAGQATWLQDALEGCLGLFWGVLIRVAFEGDQERTPISASRSVLCCSHSVDVSSRWETAGTASYARVPPDIFPHRR